jgi:hypothetical protein
LNHYKDRHTDVLDPCAITNGWFTVDFTTFLIRPAPGLPPGVEAQVKSTIARLQLNADNDYVNERVAVIRNYTLNNMTFVDVVSKYPFIAHEMEAQNFDAVYKAPLATLFVRFP